MQDAEPAKAEQGAHIPRPGLVASIVAEQAEDERLWFIPVYATEAILQQALRRLHATIEGKSPEECARYVIAKVTGDR